MASERIERGEVVYSALATARDIIGQRVGPYSVLRVLGQGGMGTVYLAHDTRLEREVALKAVLPSEQAAAGLSERLRREAVTLASLSHPNLATVFGLEESHGTFFIAMEYINGRTLEERLSDGALPIAEALQCCEQIAAGLEVAHERSIIHRDLKPANVMFTAGGTCKVLDFGLARSIPDPDVTASPDDVALTQRGSFLGTPAYMSPEQARGEPLTSRSDIFSFGAMMFRCLAGRRAFEGETVHGVLEAIMSREPDWSALPPDLPAPVLSTLKRCLAKSAAERMRHIGDVRLELRDAISARMWERRRDPAATPSAARRSVPWLIAIGTLAATAFVLLRATSPNAGNANFVQRFDVAFPKDATQADLERVQLAVSPNGRSMVVACQTAEGQALWIRSHDDGRWARIERSEGGQRPAFSADGQWLSFFRDGHIYKHLVTGRGDPIEIAAATNWYGACWTDDGNLVFCPMWGVPLQRLKPGAERPVTMARFDSDRHERAHLDPSAVPGTRWVLYCVWSGGEQTDVRVAHLDGDRDHVVMNNASSARVAATPRGDFVLFERGSIIFAAPFDRSSATVTGPETAIAEGVMNDGTRFAAYFDAAADGTLVYVPGASFAEESRLAFVDSNGEVTPFNDDRMSFCEPVFSAAANKLAVLVKGKVYRCIIYDLKRHTREYLVTGGDTLSLAISSDGRTLACTVNRDGRYGIDLMSLDDGRRLGRIEQPPDVYPSDLYWTPDGKLLAFSRSPREGTSADIWLVEPRDGAESVALVSTAGADTKPVVAPSGDWLAYQSDVSGRAEIYLVSCPDGQTTRQVSNAGGTQPAWSADGAKLYFVASEGLVAVDIGQDGATSGKPSLVYGKPFGQSDPIAREYAIAPDGRPLIVEPSERRPTVSEMHVITNWQQLLP